MSSLFSSTETLSCTQLFSRRGIGYLWDNRNGLDPGQVSIINSIYNNRKKGTIECSQTVTYKLSNKKAGKLGWGRYYGTKGSLETLEKECRGTLCSDYYYDLDIANCHFVLLEQFAKAKYGKDMPEVSRYIEDREAFLQEAGGSRDDAKQEIIRILYGGVCKNEFLMPLSVETRNFAKFLAKQEEYKELYGTCKSEDNIFGSFLSFILQTEERKCMLAMKKCLEDLGWSVDVLCYDGVMIRKDETKSLETALHEVAKFIFEALHYKVQIVNKPLIGYKLPEMSEEISKGVSREAYDEMKARFEATNFYYAPGNEMIQVRGKELMRMTLDHAREYYSRDWRFIHSQKFDDFTPFFDIWRKDQNRRAIQRIDMRDSTDPEVFVMKPQFAWQEGPESKEPLINDAVIKFIEILSLIGNEEQRRYLIKWLAQQVQNPFDKVGTAIVITGDKRTGKDTPFDFFIKYVIGLDYARNYNCGGFQFFEKHDTGRLNMFFCKVVEASRKIFIENADRFKGLITSEHEMYNDKGKRALVVANYNRFVRTSNGGCPVELSDGEQRFMVASISNARKHDLPYWTEVRRVLFNPEAGRAVGRWLADMDLTGFEFRQVPADEFQTTIVESEKTPEELFVADWNGEEVNATGMFNLYEAFCQTNRLMGCRNSISLGRALIKLIRNGKVKRRTLEGCSMYSK
jgi:hypothetical protein